MWKIPRMWEGGECWIIGGGNSVPHQFHVPQEVIDQVIRKELPPSAFSPYMEGIHNKHVIGVNAAFRLGEWIDMIVFGDKGWPLSVRKELAKFPGLKVACNPHFSSSKYRKERIWYVKRDHSKPHGLSNKPSVVSWNGNSGAAAINVAVHLGVKRIILLGFDMNMDDGKNQHWHSEYRRDWSRKRDPRKLPFHRHIRGFLQIDKDAKKMGVQIINASPNSAIKEFKKITVDELLK